MKNPLFTIIIPFREDRGWLQNAIDSVENQSFSNYELIIQQGPHNQSKNVNDGLKKASGQYIYILHEDDELYSDDVLEKLAEFIEEEEEASQQHLTWLIGAAMDSQARFFDSSFRGLESLLENNTIHGGTCVYNTEKMRELGGFDEALETGEEYDFNIRLSHSYGAPVYYNLISRYYRIEGQNKSLNFHGFESREARKKYIKDRIVKKYESLYFNKI